MGRGGAERAPGRGGEEPGRGASPAGRLGKARGEGGGGGGGAAEAGEGPRRGGVPAMVGAGVRNR